MVTADQIRIPCPYIKLLQRLDDNITPQVIQLMRMELEIDICTYDCFCAFLKDAVRKLYHGGSVLPRRKLCRSKYTKVRLIVDYASDLQDIGNSYPDSVIDFLSADFEHPHIPSSAFMTPISSGVCSTC
jgi:hypothetical protein